MNLFDERALVELPLLTQLQGMGWQHLEGNRDVPGATERESFREVLLLGRLCEAVRRINLDENGEPWLDDTRVRQAVGALTRIGAHKLMEANRIATDLLLRGTPVDGDPARHRGQDETVHFIDFEHPERNDFLVINQFRVDAPGRPFIIPDAVLFVNGIPLVVIECKSPAATDPMAEGITQLRRYSNQREEVTGDEGAERLFHANQFLVSTFFHGARAGTIGASPEQYLEWKDTSPLPTAQVAAELGVSSPSPQHLLVAGMLRPEHLLDIVRNFTLFQQSGSRTAKIVCRYQQFRAVHEAIRRLRDGQTRAEHGESDQRGGIVWHTQGSGKSLTMVFLVRKMRTLPKLRRFKVVVVTDRIDLQEQLSGTAVLTGETVRTVKDTANLQRVLREQGPDLVFAMIQKYRERDEDLPVVEQTISPDDVAPLRRAAETRRRYGAGRKRPPLYLVEGIEQFPTLNESEEILVLVDEAHRSQAGELHANLLRALPNCARVGFTGTPILLGDRKRTHEIFGSFIDRYTIRQSEQDGATVPILYEGRTAACHVADGRSLDDLYEEAFGDRSLEELIAIQARYATQSHVLAAIGVIRAKAADILRHYVEHVLPNGFKAQLVAVSRLAAVRYREALAAARDELLAWLDALDPKLLALSSEEREDLDAETAFLLRAHAHRETVRRLEFAAVISGRGNDPPAWRNWSDRSKKDALIERFKKKPLLHPDPAQRDGLAFLCVKSMLLTGFDAPVEQVLYLDRFMQGHELLQAIARVNRTHPGKPCGLVVDYCGVAKRLKDALAVYSDEDVEGALASIQDELPRLVDRHRRVLAVFLERGIASIADVNACVDLLRDLRVRAEFVARLRHFLESLEIVLPRPEALRYTRDARILGIIHQSARNRYRDDQLALIGAGEKVRQLIDEHLRASGIDPKVPPVSIIDAEFERTVEAQGSDRARASEMEHAVRHHIRVEFDQDPAHYKKLSQRLEEILQRFQENWAELAEALRNLVHEVREGRAADPTGLDAKTQAPFLGVLLEEAGGDAREERIAALAAPTVELVEHIRQEIRAVDFWSNEHAQNLLRAWIIRFLDDRDVVPFEALERTADRVVDLARALHARLIA